MLSWHPDRLSQILALLTRSERLRRLRGASGRWIVVGGCVRLPVQWESVVEWRCPLTSAASELLGASFGSIRARRAGMELLGAHRLDDSACQLACRLVVEAADSGDLAAEFRGLPADLRVHRRVWRVFEAIYGVKLLAGETTPGAARLEIRRMDERTLGTTPGAAR